MHIEETWSTADGIPVTKQQLIHELTTHIESGGKLFVGSDSKIYYDICTYANVICMYNEDRHAGGRYFVKTQTTPMKLSKYPHARLMKEAQFAVEIALELSAVFPSENIEIHLDVNSKKGNVSHSLADQLSGYAKSAGFECKVKPNSWAASGVADCHTR